MKTAISIPDAIFERAEAQAKALGMSRSEFYVSAIEQHLERLIGDQLTQRINAALDIIGDTEDEEIALWTAYDLRRMAEEGEDW